MDWLWSSSDSGCWALWWPAGCRGNHLHPLPAGDFPAFAVDFTSSPNPPWVLWEPCSSRPPSREHLAAPLTPGTGAGPTRVQPQENPLSVLMADAHFPSAAGSVSATAQEKMLFLTGRVCAFPAVAPPAPRAAPALLARAFLLGCSTFPVCFGQGSSGTSGGRRSPSFRMSRACRAEVSGSCASGSFCASC